MAFVPFTGVDLLLAEHTASLPAPDQLSGPFAARLAVVALGGQAPDLATFARVARAQVWPDDRPDARPPGVPAHDDGWADLPRAVSLAGAGTSAAGVGRAVEELSGGALAAVPATGAWTDDRLRILLDGLMGIPVLPVANIATGWLVSAQTPDSDLETVLAKGEDDDLPASRWRAGHWVVLYGREDGPGGTLLAVADTFPELGDGGIHRQPLPRMARALARDRRATGGLVLVTAAANRETVGTAVESAGLGISWWNNGTPDL